jgi:hypothetical protein
MRHHDISSVAVHDSIIVPQAHWAGAARTGGSCGARAFTGHVRCGGISGSDRRGPNDVNDAERTSAQVMAGLTSEGWPDSISGLILPCGNGADWNCHAQ